MLFDYKRKKIQYKDNKLILLYGLIISLKTMLVAVAQLLIVLPLAGLKQRIVDLSIKVNGVNVTSVTVNS